MRRLLNNPENKWALIQRRDQQNDSLAVFVHGFGGGYLRAWGRLPDSLQESADGEEPFRSWDFLFIGYSTHVVETYLDIAAILGTFLRRAASGDRAFGRQYSRFALFGHSLGTLGIRQFLCASVLNNGLLPAIHSVSLFGCPIDGSPWAGFASLLGFKIAEALRPQNPQLLMLRKWSECAHGWRSWPPANLVVGINDLVVGYRSTWFVEWPNDNAPSLTNFGHSTLVKPIDWETSDVIAFIAGALK
jgi:hypothetical protein